MLMKASGLLETAMKKDGSQIRLSLERDIQAVSSPPAELGVPLGWAAGDGRFLPLKLSLRALYSLPEKKRQ